MKPAPGVDISLTVASFGTPSGIGVEKDIHDLWRYEDILRKTTAEVIVETGTLTGLSANWFAKWGLEVITVDISSLALLCEPTSKVTRIIGSSIDLDIFDKISELVKDKRVMISLDSDHSREHVKREIELYSTLVSPGCYIVVEDGIFAYLPTENQVRDYEGNVLEAIEQTLVNYSDFERDFKLEGLYPITGSPAGWWRRKV